MHWTKLGMYRIYVRNHNPSNYCSYVYRTAEKSLIEISSLQTQLATNLATQNAYIDNLVQDAMQTTENVERGNKELKKAGEKITIARTAFWGAVVFSGVVFVWDWFI